MSSFYPAFSYPLDICGPKWKSMLLEKAATNSLLDLVVGIWWFPIGKLKIFFFQFF
jgi:hypothetical protein